MEKLKKSEELFRNAKDHLVGGVNSPVRSFRAVGGTPLFIREAHGAAMIDVDGNSYVDFVGSWGPMILGHTPAPVMAAVKEQMEKGTSFGAPSIPEVDLAVQIKKMVPSVEQIRFTSSGTEATMSALRLARAVTHRDRIVKFEGGYHGHYDALLVAAGSGATTFGVPSSPGVPEALARNTWILPYNDSDALDEIFRTQGINIAAVIIEPVCGNMGVVAPKKEFLEKLRSLTKKHGALLIFDEVMTGFRVGMSGAQGLYNITPDLTCFGKIIGGGFPVGAFGGPHSIMKELAPEGPVYQAGTLSGNPVAMTAGLATLKLLIEKNPYAALNKATGDLTDFILTEAAKVNVPVQINQCGSMFTVFFNDQNVTDYFSASQSDTKKYGVFFHALLDHGVYMPPSQFEAAFVSTEHTKAVMDKARTAFQMALKEVSKLK